jgi:diguanylate cyclase (GGDEF)-like protein
MFTPAIGAARGAQICRQILILTLISIGVSVMLTSLTIFLCAGVDSAEQLTVGALWRVSLAISFATPLIICPTLIYHGARLTDDLTRARDELARAASQDPLTGLLNRRGFGPAALSAIARAQDERRPVAALICDIDRFKSINDQFGHAFGDQALTLVADILRARFGDPPALLCRQGGEEFVILLSGVDEEEARLLAEATRAACEAHKYTGAGAGARVTLSIGVAAQRHDRLELRALLLQADAALYQAKRDGRNCVVVATALSPPFAEAA